MAKEFSSAFDRSFARTLQFIPGHSEEFHVLAQIELTGKTLYYADENLSMSDGNYYDGRLVVSTLQRAFSSFTEPKQRQSTLTITLKDADLTIRQLLDEYTWGNRQVIVYVGKGRNLNDYNIEFRGIIKFPAGISYDRNEVWIKLRDVRNKDVVVLPLNKFWESNYPNIEDGAEGKPIPVAYGDFSSTSVGVTCIDTTVNEFKICDHAIKSIDGVAKNGSPISWSDENLTEATFRISSYDPDNDEITIYFKGKVDGSSNLIENSVDILKDIQMNYIGISINNIDTDSYTPLRIELKDFKCRRFIDSELSTDTLIEELAIELLFNLFIFNDRYTIKSRMPDILTDRTFDKINIVPKSLRVEADPEKLYANRIKCYYEYHPCIDKYIRFFQEDNPNEQTRIGQIISRTLYYNWLYITTNILTQAQHLLMLYSREIAVIKFTALGEGILSQLADRDSLTFGHFENRPLVVREISKHFKTMTCTIYGYDEVKHVLPGYWTDDNAPNYDDATPEERAKSGFWTNDDGEAKPGDTESIVSHWW